MGRAQWLGLERRSHFDSTLLTNLITSEKLCGQLMHHWKARYICVYNIHIQRCMKTCDSMNMVCSYSLWAWQPLGALASNGSVFEYEVPSRAQLEREAGVRVEGDNADITVEFSILGGQVYIHNKVILVCAINNTFLSISSSLHLRWWSCRFKVVIQAIS